jgi:type IVB pilus formation R64 PilN family outer membrane protein
MKRTILSSSILAALLTVGGCSMEQVKPMRDANEKASRLADEQLAKLRTNTPVQPPPARIQSVEQVKGERWLPSKRVVVTEAMAPKVQATLARDFTVNRTFLSLTDLAERVAQLTGVPVVVSPDAANAGLQVTGGTLGGQTGGGVTVMPPGGAGLPALPGLTGANASVPFGGGISMSYSGPLSGFLDATAARYGVSWEWANGTIQFFRYATKSFQLSTLPGDSNSAIRVGSSGGGSSSSSSGASQDASISASLSVWAAIKDSVTNMLSPAIAGQPGGRVVTTPATGSVTVTDTPAVLTAVEKYIKEQNALMSRQVVVEVRVLLVDLNSAENYGIDWSLVYQSLSGDFAMAFASAFQAADSAASALTMRIPRSLTPATDTQTRWQGSTAIVRALSTQGSVSELTSGTLRTLNNQVAPMSNSRTVSYVASSSTTVVPNVGSTTAMTQSQFNTGFNMNVLPHLLDGDRLLLQYAINLSSLRALTSFTSSGSSVQSPDINSSSTLQRVSLRSGETLVLAGFESANSNETTQGVGSPKNTWAGGGVDGSRSRSQMVILIRATIEDQV